MNRSSIKIMYETIKCVIIKVVVYKYWFTIKFNLNDDSVEANKVQIQAF